MIVRFDIRLPAGRQIHLPAEVVVLRCRKNLDCTFEYDCRDLVGDMTPIPRQFTKQVSMRIARSFNRVENPSVFALLGSPPMLACPSFSQFRCNVSGELGESYVKEHS
jgi:hypothetical protein